VNNAAENILAGGIALGFLIVAFAIADHINNAQAIEFQTPDYTVRSGRYLPSA
jgi:hypothetical protein